MTNVKKINLVEEIVEKAIRMAAKEAVCEMASEEKLYEEIPGPEEYSSLNLHFRILADVEIDEFGLPTPKGGKAVKTALEKYVPLIKVDWHHPLPGLSISLTSGLDPFVRWDPTNREWYEFKGDNDLERSYYLVG